MANGVLQLIVANYFHRRPFLIFTKPIARKHKNG